MAVIGTAPSTCLKAPYQDPSWEKWGSSPALLEIPGVKWDRWIEIHPLDYVQKGLDAIGRPCPENAEYYKKLKEIDFPLYLIRSDGEFPKAEVMPRGELIERFGRFFLTSSIAWMMAMALHEGATDIGIWGVDMGGDREYADQRPGCRFFIQAARMMGVNIVLPKESELLLTPPPYPEVSTLGHRVNKHQEELQRRLAETDRQIEPLKRGLMDLEEKRLKLEGMLEAVAYAARNWI